LYHARIILKIQIDPDSTLLVVAAYRTHPVCSRVGYATSLRKEVRLLVTSDILENSVNMDNESLEKRLERSYTAIVTNEWRDQRISPFS
jgi:hypothetical protein